ncbi:MAG: TlpA family protein disulfide reductase [Candidatus Thiodiazotropha sp. (ex Lucinoma annulata)]|nr:TlpA family protein disulfide reductase [Candidatus Thiodiazotropha sp. (ex Lucinoma borealis)]MCU7870300.1 TlpA family protein disulfide reductase [Candidatus Thiodiazotropha sp. (ex Lucinoma borealis)]MCU7882694.1 TlpA family protein disulfide reductase [Candidatus Thiodiazotropha sp. (ex Lucinoma annulata)]
MIVKQLLSAFLVLISITAYAVAIGVRLYPNPKPANDFSLPDLTGKIHQITDYRGKAYILNFWATWCAPCIKEMPALERAAEILQEQEILVLTVNSGETRQEIEKFINKTPINLPILLDGNSKVMDKWKVLALPTSYIVDVEGMVVARVVGGQEWDDPSVLTQIRALTSASQSR